MIECTQPELWTSVPGSKALEEEVARYLAHVDHCAFHAALEHQEEERLRAVTKFAKSDLTIGQHVLLQETALAAAGISATEQLPSSTIVERERRTSLATLTEVGSLRLRLARLAHKLGFGGESIHWGLAMKLALALLAVIASLVWLSLFLLRKDAPTEKVALPAPVESPSVSVANANDEVPREPSPPGRNVNSPSSMPPKLSVANVKRIYVRPAEGEYNRRLAEELIAGLRRDGRFVVVPREGEADAVLVTEATRGSAAVRMRLLNRSRKQLWFTTLDAAAESTDAARDIAARVVKALSDEAREGSREDRVLRP